MFSFGNVYTGTLTTTCVPSPNIKQKLRSELFPCYFTLSQKVLKRLLPAGIYLLKVNNRNTRKRCEICSKLTIKTPNRRQWRRSGVFIVNFKHISYLVLVFLLLTLSR